MFCPLMWLVLFCVLSRNYCASADNAQTSVSAGDERVYRKYAELDDYLKNLVNRTVHRLLPYVTEATRNLNVSSSCRRDASELISGARNLRVSALRILDAVGKVPEGVLDGNIHSLGNYDECMSTSVLQEDGRVAFRGQYCLLHLRPLFPEMRSGYNLNEPIQELLEATKDASELTRLVASSAHLFDGAHPAKFGVCVPSGCSYDDVTLVLKKAVDDAYMEGTALYCVQQDEEFYTTGKIILLAILSAVGSLVLAGSGIDYYSKQKGIHFESTCARLLLCFSIQSNFPKAIGAKMPPDSLSCLFGVRSLSLFYVVYGHDWLLQNEFYIPSSAIRFINTFSEFFMQITWTSILTIETFFFLGGLLNVYSRMKEHEGGRGRQNVLERIVHRLWRIYPTYLFCMWTVVFFDQGSGRHDKNIFNSEGCKKHWWKNIVFINNFQQSRSEMCLPHLWYVAADMHLYLVSLITVPVLLRYARKGIVLHAVVLVLGLAGTVLWAWHLDIVPSSVPAVHDPGKMARSMKIYFSTVPHVAPYFTGMITGYVLSAGKYFKIPLVYRVVGWPLAGACLSMIFVPKMWDDGAEFTPLEAALFFAFSRFVFALAVAWLVVCCITGCGGVFNYILSLKIWVPIGRISYAMYLISPIVQRVYYSSTQMVIYFSTMTLIWRYLGTLVVCGLLSLAIVVCVESPLLAAEKVLFRRRKADAEKEKNGNPQVATIDVGNIETHI